METYLLISIILFILGLLTLYFGKLEDPIYDIVGFILLIIAYTMLWFWKTHN